MVWGDIVLELLARKSQGGGVVLNLARQYLENHEWGRARILLHNYADKCEGEELDQARRLLHEACRRLGMTVRDK